MHPAIPLTALAAVIVIAVQQGTRGPASPQEAAQETARQVCPQYAGRSELFDVASGLLTVRTYGGDDRERLAARYRDACSMVASSDRARGAR